MHILATNFAEHNAQHLSVNEHTSLCQYRLTITTHEQQNAGEATQRYMHGLPAISLKKYFNIIFFVFQTATAKKWPYKNVVELYFLASMLCVQPLIISVKHPKNSSARAYTDRPMLHNFLFL
jgi:hypothetical protein